VNTRAILIGLALGLGLGIAASATGSPALLRTADAVEPLGQIFLRAIQMVVIPLVAAVVFHLLNPVLRGSIWLRSLKSYLLMAAFFCALAAVYMNHYVAGIRPFYYWSMVDALIVFTVVALANALLYPRFFRDRHSTG